MASCSHQGAIGQAEPDFHACAAGQDIDTAAWPVVEERDFSFRLPPGFAEDSVQPIDSHVRRWSNGAGGVLSFDYGWYSSTLAEFRNNDDATECAVTIGSFGATAATARGFEGDPRTDGAWIVGVTWRDVRPGVHLTMFGIAPDTALASELMAAMRSTVFHLEEQPGP